jgi:hypothetical protein
MHAQATLLGFAGSRGQVLNYHHRKSNYSTYEKKGVHGLWYCVCDKQAHSDRRTTQLMPSVSPTLLPALLRINSGICNDSTRASATLRAQYTPSVPQVPVASRAP